MRIGYVLSPLLPIAVERRRNPDLIDKPVIIGGHPHERKPVLVSSAECLERGVKVGMPLRQAYMLCPEAVFLTADYESYESSYEDILAVLDSFSPAVERDDLGSAYIDAEGLTLLFGEERVLGHRIVEAIQKQLKLGARVAFGPGKFVAKVAAQLAPDAGHGKMHCIRVVAKGESSRFLRDLSIDWLRLGEFSTKRLRVLGIGTIGQFMRLPAQSLLEQFGPDAAAARRAIDDEEKDTVVPRSEPSFLERSVALDYPIVSIDSFFALAHALAASMVAHLRRHCLACQTVALYVELEDGQNVEASAQLKEPADSESDLLVALQKLVARMRSSADNEGDAGIVSVRIVLGRLTRLVLRQDGFFDGHRRRRAYLDRALDEIKERYGERVQSGITLPRTTTRTTNGHVAYPEG